TGGGAAALPGYFVQPTLLVDVAPDNVAAREEIFGPVLAAVPFDSVDEAVALANDTRYGLTASLWTQDLSAALNIVPRIQAGTVWVNSHIPLDPGLPFGGYKESGIGREFGKGAVESFTEIKSVCIAH
ncbi:aldehyde dehydrogenase family protein, partial [Chromobacterium aquaticum]